MLYYTLSTDESLKKLGSSTKGLSLSQASKRLREYGPNTIRVKGDPLWRKIIEPFANVFMLVLFIAAVLSILHDTPIDAVIIIGIMAISAIIYYVQRFSTEKVLRSLRRHTAQNVSVRRGDKVLSLDTLKLVPGDIIILGEGEKVPADARLISGTNIRTDEAMLTGESVPITKSTAALQGEKPVYEQANLLFQGSFIVSGEAVAIVTATGNDTEFGRLAALSQQTEIRSPVEKKIDRLINQIIAVIGGVAAIALVLSLIRGTEFVEAIRFVMALAVSAVPESLPIAISVVLVLGMRRMAAKKALVTKMRAIETVGVITTIATDKTGTLTKNKLSVQQTWQPSWALYELPKTLRLSTNRSTSAMHDPLDVALSDYADDSKAPQPKEKLIQSLTFSHEHAMSGNVWTHPDGHRISLKGAPEAILRRSRLSASQLREAEKQLADLTTEGYRVIALAQTTRKQPIATLADLPASTRLDFIGFIAVADTIRPEAKRAIKTALAAGVTVRMITGDHFETAYHIGRQLGMVSRRDQVFDSRNMDKMSDKELERAIKDVRVFSRVIPENKHRLLSILKRHNITAMTGDGVNDVPALSNAHVGIAMGSGAQIAKDAGDIILLDDNFKTIIDAMREGRVIIGNVRRMLYYLLATNTGEVITILGALVMGMPSPLVAVQILWVNLVTDTTMVIPLGLEKGEKDLMKRQPEKPNAPILSRYLVARMLIVALCMAVTTLVLYVIFSNLHGHEYGRTIAFCALVVMQWASAFNSRSDYESVFRRILVWSTPFYVGLALSVLLQMLAVFGPLQELLHIETVLISDLIITGAIAFVAPIIVVEIHKWVGRRQLLKQTKKA